MAKSKIVWDLFISHATEDKEAIVKPLATALSSFGLRVWYDEFTLKPGVSLSRSIDKGLAHSKYGVVVLSPSFFAKRWPEYELRGLTAKEMAGGKEIIPVWHDVNREAVLKFSPPLADKLAINASGKSASEVAIAIIEVTNPKLFERVHRRMAHLMMIEKAPIEEVRPQEVMFAPIRHKILPEDLIGRIRLIRAALLGIHTHSMEVWLDGFKRDSHPSREVAAWERICAAILEYVSMAKLTDEQLPAVFAVVLGLSVGSTQKELSASIELLAPKAFEVLSSLMNNRFPAYDIQEPLPADVPNMDPKEYLKEDRELFPKDLPNDLLENYIEKRTKEKT